MLFNVDMGTVLSAQYPIDLKVLRFISSGLDDQLISLAYLYKASEWEHCLYQSVCIFVCCLLSRRVTRLCYGSDFQVLWCLAIANCGGL